MCGIAGFMGNGSVASDLKSTVSLMIRPLNHRGPDDHGVWADTNAGVSLGHRRLAVVDLSPAGEQPMLSAEGRFVIAFNGEIYNHGELRNEVEQNSGWAAWRGHSDTETLLRCFELWGIEATLVKAVGMFAVAVWDRVNGVLTLVRDRFGEKPLYYGWVSTGFVFGSELKALRAHPGFRPSVCRLALSQYLRYSYVPAPLSIYEHAFKLEAGCLLTIHGVAPKAAPRVALRPDTQYETLRLRRWWSVAGMAQNGHASPIEDEAEALGTLDRQLQDAVRLQSNADVPLGAFLSGGIDSSTIVALMQEQSHKRVKTFTVSFEESGFDEAPYARAVADHLGTDHTEFVVTSADARAVVPLLPAMYDEPFADSSQIPTHLVCRSARNKVTVALSGDAGDELFGGYNRYLWAPQVWKHAKQTPEWMRDLLCAAAQGIPSKVWRAAGSLHPRARSGSGLLRLDEKVNKVATRLAGAKSFDHLYGNLVSEWQRPAVVCARPYQDEGVAVILRDPLPSEALVDERLRMMYWDSITYLPDDILCKVDRAAMSVSLETRVPFLDHRVAQLAWRLPIRMKIRDGHGKWALRQVLYKRVPRQLIERPKAGFALPISDWLRGPLKGWAEDLLNTDRILREGFLNPEPIRHAWKEHQDGRDRSGRIWNVLMFQSWLEANK